MVYGYQDYQNEQEGMGNSGFGKKYYWMGVIRNGKLVILGYRMSQLEAENYLNAYASGQQHVVEAFNSKDIRRISGAFKSKALEQYRDLDVALRRNVISQSEQMKAKRDKQNNISGYKEYKAEVKRSKPKRKPIIEDMFHGLKEEY